jgi:hypothetical protein
VRKIAEEREIVKVDCEYEYGYYCMKDDDNGPRREGVNVIVFLYVAASLSLPLPFFLPRKPRTDGAK